MNLHFRQCDDNLEAAIHDSDILGSVAAEYNLDEQCEEQISPKLAGIVNKLLRNRLNEDKLKEKLNKRTRPKNCDNITGRAVARALIGGCIFIYSGSARLQ